MLFSESELNEIRSQLSGDTKELRTAAVAVGCDPLAVVRAGHRLFGRSSYFSGPGSDIVASLGDALHLTTAGPDRFHTMEAQLADLPAMVADARLMLGFSFGPSGGSSPEWDGFGPFDIVLPSVAVIRDDAGTRLVVALAPGVEATPLLETLADLSPWDPPPPPDPGVHTVESRPATSEWQTEVGEAVLAIRGGSFEKVVLARSVVVESERATDPYDLVFHLMAANPASYVYATVVGDSAFVGASPELLLAQTGREIHLNPLAGSARRGKGDDDVEVGRQLLESPKNRAEHAIVVNDLVARLEPVTEQLEYPAGPALRRMATVQHLSTEISGRLAETASTFDVLDSIHPTPAVGGMPREEALAFIDKVEGMDRGWYSGGVGWISPQQGAVVALALRCALVNGRTSRLYAGNGIVADSDPAAELEETRLKFQPLLTLLAAT